MHATGGRLVHAQAAYVHGSRRGEIEIEKSSALKHIILNDICGVDTALPFLLATFSRTFDSFIHEVIFNYTCTVTSFMSFRYLPQCVPISREINFYTLTNSFYRPSEIICKIYCTGRISKNKDA